MNIDLEAQKRIEELEGENEELIFLNDLLHEELTETKALLKVAKGQYQHLLNNYKLADVL